jgi:Tol biopolymer transport system component
MAVCALVAGRADGAFPGEPGSIAYVSGLTKNIWLIDPDGTHRRQLTPRLHEEQYKPSWSPGGRWLMYTTAKGLWIVRADGSGRRRIGRYASDGAWSPDGARVVYASRPTKSWCSEIYSMRLDGSAVRRLTYTSACESDPSYSADGKSVVFSAQQSYTNQIVVQRNTQGGRPDGFTVIGSGFSPDWSPDGKSIAFAFGSTIRVVDPTGLPIRQIELAGPNNFELAGVAWSPRGDQFVFSQMQATRNDLGILRGGDRIYRVSLDGSNRSELTQTSIEDDLDPAWRVRR